MIYVSIVSHLLCWHILWSVHSFLHHDVIKWKHFPSYWPFVQGIHWSLVNSRDKAGYKIGGRPLICRGKKHLRTSAFSGNPHLKVMGSGPYEAYGPVPFWTSFLHCKGQWHGALIFSLISTWINGWVNNCEAGDLRCYGTHYYVTVMMLLKYRGVS